MPAWLCREGKAEWKRVVAALEAAAVLSAADRAVLAAYCQAWGEYVRAVARVRKAGTLLSGPRGTRYRNPDLQLVRESRDAMHSLGAALGLNPVARRRLPASGRARDDDPKQEFFENMGA